MNKSGLILFAISVFFAGCNKNKSPKEEVKHESCTEFYQNHWNKIDAPSEKNSLTVNEMGSLLWEDTQVPVFHLRASGLEKGTKFSFALRDLNGNHTPIMNGVYLGEGVYSTDGNSEKAYSSFLRKSLRKGESSFFALEEENESGLKSTVAAILPFPEKKVLSGGASISTHFVNAPESFFLFDIENLSPGEKVNLVSHFEGNIDEQALLVSEMGKLSKRINISEKGKSNQKGLLEINRDSENNTVEFSSSSDEKNPPSIILFTIDSDLTNEQYTEMGKNFYQHMSKPKKAKAD